MEGNKEEPNNNNDHIVKGPKDSKEIRGAFLKIYFFALILLTKAKAFAAKKIRTLVFPVMAFPCCGHFATFYRKMLR